MASFIIYAITFRGTDGKFETVEFPHAEWISAVQTLQDAGNAVLVVTGTEYDDGISDAEMPVLRG